MYFKHQNPVINTYMYELVTSVVFTDNTLQVVPI